MTKLIEVVDLKKYFPTPSGMLHAVDGVSFGITEGKTMGVVGESGCGKSTLGRTIIHLQSSTGGKIFFDGDDITHVNKIKMHTIRRNMQIIFQDPYSSLNPRMTVRDAILEPLAVTKKYSRFDMYKRAHEVMELVGIDHRMQDAYPHELDGGRRQRVGIGRALALKPRFIVCDEPVSALDVSIQAQILNLLKFLQREEHLTYMFVTHDLSVVRHVSDDICVMYLGQVMEICPSKQLFAMPSHPYTKALLSAIPSTNIHDTTQRVKLHGELTSPINPKPGCRFMSRCMYASNECAMPQKLEQIGLDHFVACCRTREINNIAE